MKIRTTGLLFTLPFFIVSIAFLAAILYEYTKGIPWGRTTLSISFVLLFHMIGYGLLLVNEFKTKD